MYPCSFEIFPIVCFPFVDIKKPYKLSQTVVSVAEVEPDRVHLIQPLEKTYKVLAVLLLIVLRAVRPGRAFDSVRQSDNMIKALIRYVVKHFVSTGGNHIG